MFCTNCGKEIDNGSVFCTHCGTRQIQVESDLNDMTTAGSADENADHVESQVNEISGQTANSADQSPAANTEIAPSSVSVTGQATTVTTSDSHAVKPTEQARTDFTAPSNSDKKKSTSSLVVFGIIAVAVIFALFLLFGKGRGYKDYKDLVQDYYSAIYKEDFKALLKTYDKEDQKDLKDEKEDIEEQLKTVKKTFNDIYGRSWNKKINIINRNKIDSDDGVTFYSVTTEINKKGNQFLYIKKYKDRYYIDSSNDPF